MPIASEHPVQVADQLLARNRLFERFFEREALRLAHACCEMSERFLRGGRLIAFGRGPYATDAQHVSVEFVHPVIVGKRALPALDLSLDFGPWLDALVQPDDMVMGFGPPDGDAEVTAALRLAAGRGAMTFALPGAVGTYAVEGMTADPFIHQELIEILYHTLWETVHVFFEHRELGHDVGDAGFLYPFLGREKQPAVDLVREVASSIRMGSPAPPRWRCSCSRRSATACGPWPICSCSGWARWWGWCWLRRSWLGRSPTRRTGWPAGSAGCGWRRA